MLFVYRLLLPALALAGEAANEAVGRIHLLGARVGVVLQSLLGGHCLVELALHLVELGSDLVKLALRLSQLRVGALELRLCHLE